jgi:NADH-quinone oxidoreductase subunit M
MTGTYNASTWAAIIAATGVILSAVYALTLYRRVIFGTMDNPALAAISDLGMREAVIFAPLILGTLWLGVNPDAVFHVTAASTQALVDAFQAAKGG